MQIDPARIFLKKDKSTIKQMLETLLNIYALTTQIYLFFFALLFFSFLIHPTLFRCKECRLKFLQIKILLPPAKVAQSLENTSAKSPSTHTARAEAHAVHFARLQSQRGCVPYGITHSCLASQKYMSAAGACRSGASTTSLFPGSRLDSRLDVSHRDCARAALLRLYPGHSGVLLRQ